MPLKYGLMPPSFHESFINFAKSYGHILAHLEKKGRNQASFYQIIYNTNLIGCQLCLALQG
jgi:hypothetical protein